MYASKPKIIFRILFEVKSVSFLHFFVIIVVFVGADGDLFRQITAGKTGPSYITIMNVVGTPSYQMLMRESNSSGAGCTKAG